MKKENYKELIDSPNPALRQLAALNGYGHDILFKDEDYGVRAAVASLGSYLPELAKDDVSTVRVEVAKQGYKLEKFLTDQNFDVAEIAFEEIVKKDPLQADEFFYSEDKRLRNMASNYFKKKKQNVYSKKRPIN